MSLLEWYNTYNVNVEKLDADHKEILQMINRLHDSVLNNNVKPVMAQVLIELSSHVRDHFRDEEDLMSKLRYPQFAHHKKLHETMTKELMFILRKLKHDEEISVFELMGFLRNFFAEHIIKEDKKIGLYIESLQEKQPV